MRKAKTLGQFQKNSSSCYSFVRNHNLQDLIEKYLSRTKNTWNMSSAISEMKKYKNRKEFILKSKKCYEYFLRNDKKYIIEDFFNIRVPYGYGTIDDCLEQAKKHKTSMQWRKSKDSLYGRASKLKCIKQCTAHMESTPEFITLEMCIASAKKYKTRIQWKKGNPSHYNKCRKNGWLEECSKHLPQNTKLRSIIRVDDGRLFESLSDAARISKTVPCAIKSSIKRNGTAGGYHWKYADE